MVLVRADEVIEQRLDRSPQNIAEAAHRGLNAASPTRNVVGVDQTDENALHVPLQELK